MDIREAVGYLQAIADNCNDAPRYQRALQTVIEFAETSYDEQNRLICELDNLRRVNLEMVEEIRDLKHELIAKCDSCKD